MSLEEPSHLAILTNYLVKPCPGVCKNPKMCLFYHTDSERRRVPFNGKELLYNEFMCPVVSSGNPCKEDCRYSHTFQEMIYHPNKYKVSWCEQGNCKGYNLCSLAHRPNERLRKLTHVTIDQSYIISPLSSHLDLNVFKVDPCPNPVQHNPKLCLFYHSNRDRRRTTFYTYEMCPESEKDQCKYPETCTKAHNIVEQLYHPDKYKTKFCTITPDKIYECEYGNYCSFAHSESDIKLELIHNYQRTQEFYINSLKTVWCPFIRQHDKGMCVYAHNWQDFRRKPKQFIYSPVPCTDWKTSTFILSYEEGGCSIGLSCTKCHGWKEIEFHPEVYKMKPCSSGTKCSKQQDCSYYHSEKDSRVAQSPFKEISNSFLGGTPHPQKQYLSPEVSRTFQTPNIKKQQILLGPSKSSEAEYVKHVNSTTKDFLLHRAPKRFENSQREEFFFGSNNHEGFNDKVPHNRNYRAGEDLSIDQRVLQFLVRHKLKHLKNQFVGVKWEALGSFHLLGTDEKEFQRAWVEEKEDQDQFELINHDIALFTGQKTGQTPDLKKFALQDDINDIILTFPKTSFIPSILKCPITKKLMRDPTIFPLDGRTYERSSIIDHINSNYSPIEAEQHIKNLHSNENIRKKILNIF